MRLVFNWNCIIKKNLISICSIAHSLFLLFLLCITPIADRLALALHFMSVYALHIILFWRLTMSQQMQWSASFCGFFFGNCSEIIWIKMCDNFVIQRFFPILKTSEVVVTLKFLWLGDPYEVESQDWSGIFRSGFLSIYGVIIDVVTNLARMC